MPELNSDDMMNSDRVVRAGLSEGRVFELRSA